MSETATDPDSPPGEPSLRAVLELVPDVLRHDPVEVALHLREEYGYAVRVPPLHPALDTDVYLLTHPDDVQRILQTEPGRFGPLDVPGARDFGEVVQDSIVNLAPEDGGDAWLRRTRMLSPEFGAGTAAGHVEGLLETTLAALAEFETGRAADGGPGAPDSVRVWTPEADALWLLPAMRRLSLRLLGESLLGSDVRAHEVAVIDAVDTLRSAFKRRRLDPVAGRVTRHLPEELHLPGFLRGRLGDPSIRLRRRRDRTEAALERLADTAEAMVARRERAPLASGDALGTWLVRPDPVTGEPLSPATLRGEVVGLLIAGHATTSAALTWAFALLAGRPGLQERIAREARATGLLASLPDAREQARERAGEGAGDDTTEDGESFLDALSLTRRVWQETLRLYPTLPLFGRTAAEPVTLAGTEIPEGAQLLLSPYVTHRDPAFWPDPDRFDPDRFLPERAADRHEFAYFPFSGGPHACLGESVATTEALVVLAATLATHRVEFADDTGRLNDGTGSSVGVDSAINLQPDRDVAVRLLPRDPAPD
jgi:cytochrome P450